MDCADADPQIRSRHQMVLAQEGGLEKVRAHLTEQWVALREEQHQRTDLVDDVCHWLGNLMEQFSGMAHPETGATMAWWQARAYMHAAKEAIALSARARVPERVRFSDPAPDVPGFTRAVRPAPGRPFPEEAAYAGVTRITELDEQDYTPGYGE